VILPGKIGDPSDSLLAIAAMLLEGLATPSSPELLWRDIRSRKAEISFDYFVMALTLLFAVGAINYSARTHYVERAHAD
jgi:ABC-3C biological conflict system middle component